MAIPGPGTAISMNTIAGEFGGTVPHSLSEYYRGGGLVPNSPGNAAIPTSGAIPMGSFYGSANRAAISLPISTNSYNYDVYANRGPAYVAGTSDITVTIAAPVTVGSTSTGAYALLIPSSFSPTDTVTVINNGVIQGMGGAAGNGGSNTNGSGGAAGGNAIYVNRPTTITNNGVIASGGGGGGGGGAGAYTFPKAGGLNSWGGGGGGGGSGFNGGALGTGGARTGPISNSGSPGATGTSPAGGAGGAGGPQPSPSIDIRGGPGGAGGSRGAAGASGSPGNGTNATKYSGAAGGPTGSYIVGNPFVTWPATGTRQGNVS